MWALGKHFIEDATLVVTAVNTDDPSIEVEFQTDLLNTYRYSIVQKHNGAIISSGGPSRVTEVLSNLTASVLTWMVAGGIVLHGKAVA